MDRPRTPTDLRIFIGCVNYYRYMWPIRAHILKPLTDKSGLNKKDRLKWTEKCKRNSIKFFFWWQQMHSLLIQIIITVLTYILTFQISAGACIIQDGQTVAYFRIKLNKSQSNYTTMEKEMLSIVATLENFRSMLLSANIHVFTDHKNWLLIASKLNKFCIGATRSRNIFLCYITLKIQRIYLRTTPFFD